MKKPVIVVKTSWKEFGKVEQLARSVYESMYDNMNFINPHPALSLIKSGTDDLSDANTKWGSVHNRGSHENYIDLQCKSKLLHLRLTQLCAWCMSSLDAGMSYPEQTVVLSTSGFQLKRPGAPVGRLQEVQNFRRFLSRSLNYDQVKLKWAKPMDVGANTNVKSYIVYHNTTDNFSTATVVASPTKTTYMDSPGSGTWFYWVSGTNNMGTGAISNPVMVKIA